MVQVESRQGGASSFLSSLGAVGCWDLGRLCKGGGLDEPCSLHAWVVPAEMSNFGRCFRAADELICVYLARNYTAQNLEQA